jgi:thioredoxin-dependent peroxiredoxin
MTTLKPGDAAPQFSATDQHGNEISLNSLKGKKIVLYFYPKDDTPGCTAEACNLRDNHSDLMNKGYVVIGVSPDPLKAHTKFTDKYELPFSLLPDPEKTIINAYGVWGPKKFLGKAYEGVNRSTFVIDENGIIEKVFTQVDTKNHTEQILNS